MPLDGEQTYKALLSKGFLISNNKSVDHKWIEFWHEGKLTRARTKFSHNNQELGDYLISQISKQIYLTKQQLIQFSECTLSQEQYIEILKGRGML